MKLTNLIPLKEAKSKGANKAYKHFLNNMGGNEFNSIRDELDNVLGEIDDIFSFNSRESYDTTKEFEEMEKNTYNYFLPHLAYDDTITPDKVNTSIDKVYKLYSKKLENRYKELNKKLIKATENLKKKVK